ncbi:MAG: DUF177 domain-containing protein [Thermotogae bacterium]|nr:DUF177 domain-containing protein [Thermotogota bacterium]
MDLLKVDISELKKIEKLVVEGTLDWKEIELDIGKCRILTPVKVKYEMFADGDTMILNGDVKTKIEHPCVRCLKPVELEIYGKMEAIYLPRSEMKYLKKEEELEELENTIYYSGDELDLTDRVIEAIILEVPMKVLCSEDCKGLCPVCGENLNEHPDHVCVIEKDIDPRFQDLLKLKEMLGNQ